MVVMLLHDKADIGTGIVVAVVDLWISVEIALGKHFAVFVGIQESDISGLNSRFLSGITLFSSLAGLPK